MICTSHGALDPATSRRHRDASANIVRNNTGKSSANNDSPVDAKHLLRPSQKVSYKKAMAIVRAGLFYSGPAAEVA